MLLVYSTVTWVGVRLVRVRLVVGVSLVVCLGRLLQRLLLVDVVCIHNGICVWGCQLVLLIIVLRHLLVP